MILSRMPFANDNDFSAKTAQNRAILERHGVIWQGGFEKCVRDTQALHAKDTGQFLSFDEAAYHITEGGLDALRNGEV